MDKNKKAHSQKQKNREIAIKNSIIIGYIFRTFFVSISTVYSRIDHLQAMNRFLKKIKK